MRLMPMLLCAAALLAPAHASSQEIPESMRLVIEEPSDADLECGITTELLKSTARATMRYSRITETEEASNPMIYINTLSLSLPGGCVTSMEVSVHSFGQTFDEVPILGLIELSSSGEIISSGPKDHAERIRASVRNNMELALSSMADKIKKRRMS